MHGSNVFSTPRAVTARRRLVLAAALALALAAWLAPRAPVAVAQESRPAAAAAAPVAPGAAAADSPGAGTGSGATADPAARDDKGKGRADAVVKDEKDPATGQRTITVTKNGKTVTVTGIPGDREFDSFGEMVHTEPTLAIMIIAIVAVVFLAPVFAIALILSYRMRKTRMQNETMLKLAEKGIVGPTEAIAAVAMGTMPAQADAAARAAGVGAAVERAQHLRSPRGLVRSAQGHRDGRHRPRAHDLFRVRRPHAERDRPGVAVCRHRLRRAVVVRAAADRAAQRRRGNPRSPGRPL